MACEALKAQYDALEAQIAQLEAAIAKEPPQEQSVGLTRLHQLEDQAFALGQQLAACVAASTPPLPRPQRHWHPKEFSKLPSSI
jgi:hypothetical protein